MKKNIAMVISLVMVMFGCNATESPVLLKTVVINMGKDGKDITDARYNRFFKQGSATEGVSAIIAAGNFYINGYPLPANEKELNKLGPQGYKINQVPWLYYDSTKKQWKGGYEGQTPEITYSSAALDVAKSIVPGLEVRLYDFNKDGYTDRIEADYKEGVIVNHIVKKNNDYIRIYRSDIDSANKTNSEGRVFDGPHFTTTSNEMIKLKNFDQTITPGCVALFWYGKSGWQIQRAREVNGIFVDGEDHKSYNIDGKIFQDAMHFSRDNLFISNRPGEYTNAQKYFGLLNNRDGLKVSLWLVPTTDPQAQGAPISLTSNSSAKNFLKKAIAVAKYKLANTKISSDGKDVPVTEKWVTQSEYSQLVNAIQRADAAAMSASSTSSLLDYQVYLLYLTLNGSSNDIGAKFGGFNYIGFDNELKVGRQQ